jgi:plastocyanin
MRMLSLTALLCTLAIVAAGCGGNDNSSSSGSGSSGSSSSSSDTSTTKQSSSGGGGAAQTLKISADPGGGLKFDKSSLTAKAGKVTIVMDNPSSLPHAVELEGNGVEAKGDTVTKGGVSKATATVKAGTYDYYCPVDGHRAAGMEGKLTVQ